MACIENFFDLTLSDLTTTTHTITGLTSASSSTSVSYVSKEASLLFAKAIYQTLKDGGYNVTLDETNYKITVLGFSFFVLGVSTSSTIKRLYMRFYALGSTSAFDTATSSYAYMNVSSGSASVQFCLRLRGNEDALTITYSGQGVYTRDSNGIAVCRGINLATGEYAWVFGSAIQTNSYVILSSDIYTREQLNTSYDVNNMYEGKGLNTDTLISCAPVLVWYKTIYMPSLIAGNTTCITRGQYYKIGNETYWAAGYKTSTTSTATYSGACTLIKVS